MHRRLVLISLLVVLFPVWAFAADYHADSDGGAANLAACTGSDPGNGSRCSMSQVNGVPQPSGGDNTIYLYDDGTANSGVFTTAITPSNSGVSSSERIIYVAASGETPVITTSGGRGFSISGDKDYIKIDGITFTDCLAWGQVANGSDYFELTNSTFDTSGYVNGNKGIYIWNSGGTASTHNWIHGNTFGKNLMDTASCGDDGGQLYVGVYQFNNGCDNNTVEDNIFYHGGHHLMEAYSQYNIIRNNTFHNEGFFTQAGCTWGTSGRDYGSGEKYGNRILQLYTGQSATDMYNLLEDNRMGYAAFAVDGGQEGNMTITSGNNIVRYNYSYYSETMGLAFKEGNATDNRAYNNTLYYNGQDSSNYPDAWTGYGAIDWRNSVGCHPSSSSNILKNNVLYQGFNADIANSSNYSCTGRITDTNNWKTSDGAPPFTDTDVSDPTSTTLPDLTLSSCTGPCDNGTYLTQANGSGSSSTTLIVDDALYFQDGTWGSSLSNIQADHIAIGTVGNTVQISSINYGTDTITLTSAMTWSDNANIWLYKKSDGEIVLYGTAPDQGAHEYRITSPPEAKNVTLTDGVIIQ